LAETLPDRETRRLLAALEEMKAPVAGVFVNRVLMDAKGCKRCTQRQMWQWQTLAKIRKWKVPVMVVPEYEAEIAGKSGLARMTKSLWRLR